MEMQLEKNHAASFILICTVLGMDWANQALPSTSIYGINW